MKSVFWKSSIGAFLCFGLSGLSEQAFSATLSFGDRLISNVPVGSVKYTRLSPTSTELVQTPPRMQRSIARYSAQVAKLTSENLFVRFSNQNDSSIQVWVNSAPLSPEVLHPIAAGKALIDVVFQPKSCKAAHATLTFFSRTGSSLSTIGHSVFKIPVIGKCFVVNAEPTLNTEATATPAPQIPLVLLSAVNPISKPEPGTTATAAQGQGSGVPISGMIGGGQNAADDEQPTPAPSVPPPPHPKANKIKQDMQQAKIDWDKIDETWEKAVNDFVSNWDPKAENCVSLVPGTDPNDASTEAYLEYISKATCREKQECPYLFYEWEYPSWAGIAIRIREKILERQQELLQCLGPKAVPAPQQSTPTSRNTSLTQLNGISSYSATTTPYPRTSGSPSPEATDSAHSAYTSGTSGSTSDSASPSPSYTSSSSGVQVPPIIRNFMGGFHFPDIPPQDQMNTWCERISEGTGDAIDLFLAGAPPGTIRIVLPQCFCAASTYTSDQLKKVNDFVKAADEGFRIAKAAERFVELLMAELAKAQAQNLGEQLVGDGAKANKTLKRILGTAAKGEELENPLETCKGAKFAMDVSCAVLTDLAGSGKLQMIAKFVPLAAAILKNLDSIYNNEWDVVFNDLAEILDQPKNLMDPKLWNMVVKPALKAALKAFAQEYKDARLREEQWPAVQDLKKRAKDACAKLNEIFPKCDQGRCPTICSDDGGEVFANALKSAFGSGLADDAENCKK